MARVPIPEGSTYHDSPEGIDHQRRCALGRRHGQVAADERRELREEDGAGRRPRRTRLDDIWEGR